MKQPKKRANRKPAQMGGPASAAAKAHISASIDGYLQDLFQDYDKHVRKLEGEKGLRPLPRAFPKTGR